MQLNTFTYIAIMICTGLLFGRIAKQFKLPNVTGYLIGGLLIGPSVFELIPENTIESFTIISDIALGFIAFTIGNEFKISYFKRVGALPIVIAIFESLFAVAFVFGSLMAFGCDLSFSLLLSAIAAATAPAATIMVIKQYNAKGPVTETLLSVVAIDDATALIMFGINSAIAQALLHPENLSISQAILSPIWEIFGSLIIGFTLGMLFCIPLRWFKKDGNRLSITIGFVFLAVGLADLLHCSALLLCMAMGAGLTNFSSNTSHIVKLTDQITPPIFLLFFVASGAELKLSVLPTIGVVGIIYVLFRVVGKIFGAAFGAAICKAEKNIKKYLGASLIPQAGVAIGLSLVATSISPTYGPQIRAIILCATLIYELVGPSITKMSLKKAGEISA